MAYVHITIRDFSKGWNTTDNPANLTDDAVFQLQMPGFDRPDLVVGSQYPQLLNCFVTYSGKLILRDGQHKVTPNLGAAPTGVSRYYSPIKTWLMLASGGNVLAYDEIGGTLQTIFQPLSLALPSPSSAPLCADQPAANYPSNGGPFPNNSSTTPYFYSYAYRNSSTGAVSPPSPSSAAVVVASSVVRVSTFDISPSSGVDSVLVYRSGGTLPGPLLVADLSVREGLVYGNGAGNLGEGSIYTPSSPVLINSNGSYQCEIDDGAGDAILVSQNNVIAATGITPPSAAFPSLPVDFVSMYNLLYFANGSAEPPQKWNGTSASSPIGIAAPVLPVMVAPYANGSYPVPGGTYSESNGQPPFPNSSVAGASPYTYYYTYSNSLTAIESNPSPPSEAIAIAPNGSGGGSWGASLFQFQASADPVVDTINIYRVGGTSTAMRFVASVGVGDSSYLIMNPNTVAGGGTLSGTSYGPNYYSTTVVDQLADINLSLRDLSFQHVVPGPAIAALYAHKQRLFGFGDPANPSRLYFSSFGQPDYWPTSVVDPLNDGGFIDVEARQGNPIVALCSTGSLLVIGSANTTSVLLGDSFNDFVVRRISDSGVIARRSMVRCHNQVMYLGPDGMVYAVSDTEPAPVAISLEATLEAIPRSRLAQACACYLNQRYLLFIPGAAGAPPTNLAYDFRVSAWTDLSDPALAATAAYASEGQALYGEVLLATTENYLWTDGTSYNGIISALSRPDAGISPLPVAFETPAFELGRPTFTKRAKTLRIEGTLVVPPGSSVVATIFAKTEGRPDIAVPYTLQPSASPAKLLDVEVPANLVGRVLSVTITGTALSMEIDTIDASFVYLRERI